MAEKEHEDIYFRDEKGEYIPPKKEKPTKNFELREYNRLTKFIKFNDPREYNYEHELKPKLNFFKFLAKRTGLKKSDGKH